MRNQTKTCNEKQKQKINNKGKMSKMLNYSE